ncbi:hypothetical protein MRB53_037928 [Persea americana]|nr:hypothetical protein MRB53_037928 [Persea americana]
MLQRVLRRGFTPVARKAAIPYKPAFQHNLVYRTVTTDAASSHAEKEHVPEAEDEPFDVRLHDESFETYQLDPPEYTMKTTKQELKQMYYDMVSIRSAALYSQPLH